MNGKFMTFIGSGIVMILARVLIMLDLFEDISWILHMLTVWFVFLVVYLKLKDSEYKVYAGFIWLNIPLMLLMISMSFSALLVFVNL